MNQELLRVIVFRMCVLVKKREKKLGGGGCEMDQELW